MTTAEELNRVIRAIRTTGDTHQVILEREYGTDAPDLWNACTEPRRLARWFEPVRGDLALGGRYVLTDSGTEGEILRCENGRHLAITWEYGGNVSHVDVDLIAVAADRTVLRLTHRVPSDDHWDTYGPGATGVGWDESLRELGRHLAGDARSEHAEPDEQLIRRTATAWGRADRASGTPAERADLRAQRTASFYLEQT